AEILKQETELAAAQADASNASAQQAKADAQAILAKIEGYLAQAQADKYTQAQAVLDAQILQDSYAQAVAADTYSMVQAQATKVQAAIAADPYAYTAAQQAGVTQAIAFANTQQTDVYAAAQQAVIQATIDQAAIDAAATQAAAAKLAADNAATAAAAAQQAAVTQTVTGSTSVRLSVKAKDQKTGAAAVPISAAIVVVDGIEYPTDASGDVWVPGLDVGLHDVHVFADGYEWMSIYQYTANAAGNTFALSPVATIAANSSTNGPLNHIPLNVTFPAGTVVPQYGELKLTFTDSYGHAASTNISAIPASNISPVTVYYYANITPYANVAGVITATSTTCDIYGFNCTQTSYNATPTMNVATKPGWNNNTVPPTAITLTKPAVQTPAAVSSQVAIVRFDANLLNTTGRIDGVFTWADANGVLSRTSVSGVQYAPLVSNVNQGAAQAVINFWGVTPAIGSTVTGNLSFEEMGYDSYTGMNVTTNVVDIGSQSFTVIAAPYVNTGNILPATRTVNVTFPVVPPTSITVLTLQSITPPIGMSAVTNLGIRDSYAYWDMFMDPMMGITFPYTFSTIKRPKGMVQISTSVEDRYSNNSWNIFESHAVGASVNMTSGFTTMPILNSNQSGGTITYDFGGATMGSIRLMDATTGMVWALITPPSNKSITLPVVPTMVTNPWKKGAVYSLQYWTNIISNATYNRTINSFLTDTNIVLENQMDGEWLGSNVGIPYTY
ncbi:MAG: hypothetical protein R8M45_06895, partial [Ghiorsea sp.]